MSQLLLKRKDLTWAFYNFFFKFTCISFCLILFTPSQLLSCFLKVGLGTAGPQVPLALLHQPSTTNTRPTPHPPSFRQVKEQLGVMEAEEKQVGGPFSAPWNPVRSDRRMGPVVKDGKKGPRKGDKMRVKKRNILGDSRTKHLQTKWQRAGFFVSHLPPSYVPHPRT